ncbi:hypothetical protein JYU34_020982 [Plutella xylostella]|uniref:Peptidase A2 domain-containing protein n=1 Tax=Plutella xylostella TaxID=51655 RepID=A0ABQ7PSD8_PLUXY|nr:hypothetical protein JYU34_020982 [Plutella xylostella]
MITVSHNKNKSLQEHKSSHGNNHFDAKKYAVHKPNQQVHSYVSNTQSKSEKTIRSCAMCQSNHALYTCVLFLNLPVNDRVKFVENKNLCPNCLRSGHSISDCTYGSCKLCHHKHNGLLHNQANSSSSLSVVRANSSSPADNNNIPTISAALHSQSEPNSRENRCDIGLHTKLRGLQPTLLSTALIEVADVNNEYHLARALLDSGSQHSFITEKLSKKLKLPLIQSTVRISGVGQHVTNSSQLCEIAMRSKSCSYNTMLQCLVLPCITSNLPSVGIDVDSLCMPENIQLADPTFNIPSEIDLLIGADRFWELLEGERIRLQSGPYLQNSKLGWFISGRIDNTNLSNKQQVHCHFTSTIDNDSLDMQMRKFWEIEEVPITKKLTADELKCEELFCTTTTRDETGRFCVRIPLKESADALGDSYSTARSRFMSLERKLQRSPEYKQMYCDFMNEYESLGHMTRIGIDKPELPNYTLSHHGVFKESSSTTRLRVVFNASVPTKSSKSLNDIQYSGPALQNDIFSILLRFRQYKYVVCADIEKMYRQVLIQPDQRSLQLIVWRDSPEDPLGVYQLNTVTYGTASAAYLSMRCLRQLASECGDDVIARVINEDFLVDDLITGCDDYQQLHSICEKTYQVLEAAGFILRKWTFNSKFSENSSTEMFIGEHTQSKTLGLGWLNTTDELHFTTKVENAPRLTKRVMLSIISQIYDPLGLLAPAVIISKILIQKLWLCKIDWEDAVPDSIVKTWNSFIQTLSTLVELRVPRYVRSEHTQHTELHIFSDASQDAYGSCAYIRSYDDLSEVTVKLLCAKSKVAPLKGLSIPRLELCGALVGARLCHKIVNVLRLKFDRIYCWTDSTIVIGWLRMSPHLLKQFVQNRVNEINELTGDLTWLHVNGLQNPADLLSRGLNLSELSQSSRWWHGPLFLKENNLNFSQHLPNELPELPELKTQTTSLICTVDNVFDFERYSTLNRMKRVVAYVLRFISNTRPQRGQKTTGPLSVDEITAAERALIIIAQKQMFPEEYHNLENNLPISNKKGCSITGLNVFLDKFKIIRVGGRLSNATEFDYNKKHPVLLCSKHRFTLLLVRDEHIRLLHAGPQLLLATVRECYWPLGGRNLARQVVRRCVICSRLKGNTLTPYHGRPTF